MAVGSADQITSTVAGLLAEYAKPPARSIFWRDDLKTNEDPFDGIQGTIFEQDWDFKVRFCTILRAFKSKLTGHARILAQSAPPTRGVTAGA